MIQERLRTPGLRTTHITIYEQNIHSGAMMWIEI